LRGKANERDRQSLEHRRALSFGERAGERCFFVRSFFLAGHDQDLGGKRQVHGLSGRSLEQKEIVKEKDSGRSIYEAALNNVNCLD
jgi:hypothetical protein